MSRLTRRTVLKNTLAAGACGLPALLLGRQSRGAGQAPANELRVAVIGLGGVDIPGSVGGRGRQLIRSLRQVPGVQIATLCDVDTAILDHGVKLCEGFGAKVTTQRDFRKVFDDKTIDAVFIATPNHWHALHGVLACQAGKDAYVEKPLSHSVWEGRQLAAAAKKYNRIVQNGIQRRSSNALPQAIEEVRAGKWGRVVAGHALVYRPRDGLGLVTSPTPVPPTVDYDLWAGPTPMGPVLRKNFHYEWHWFWGTGNGEMGNNGIHVIDICRWMMGIDTPPKRTLSLGGRIAFNDSGETANTQLALFEGGVAPLVCEIRNVKPGKDASIGKFRGASGGIVVDFENGYFAGDMTGGAFFDRSGKKVREIKDGRKAQEIERDHVANFIAAVRSRKPADLKAEATVGHISASYCHMANLSHRLGAAATLEQIGDAVRDRPELADAGQRCRDYLAAAGVSFNAGPAILGQWVQYDAQAEKFTGPTAEKAAALDKPQGRAPFVFPTLVS